MNVKVILDIKVIFIEHKKKKKKKKEIKEIE